MSTPLLTQLHIYIKLFDQKIKSLLILSYTEAVQSPTFLFTNQLHCSDFL